MKKRNSPKKKPAKRWCSIVVETSTAIEEDEGEELNIKIPFSVYPKTQEINLTSSEQLTSITNASLNKLSSRSMGNNKMQNTKNDEIEDIFDTQPTNTPSNCSKQSSVTMKQISNSATPNKKKLGGKKSETSEGSTSVTEKKPTTETTRVNNTPKRKADATDKSITPITQTPKTPTGTQKITQTPPQTPSQTPVKLFSFGWNRPDRSPPSDGSQSSQSQNPVQSTQLSPQIDFDFKTTPPFLSSQKSPVIGSQNSVESKSPEITPMKPVQPKPQPPKPPMKAGVECIDLVEFLDDSSESSEAMITETPSKPTKASPAPSKITPPPPAPAKSTPHKSPKTTPQSNLLSFFGKTPGSVKSQPQKSNKVEEIDDEFLQLLKKPKKRASTSKKQPASKKKKVNEPDCVFQDDDNTADDSEALTQPGKGIGKGAQTLIVNIANLPKLKTNQFTVDLEIFSADSFSAHLSQTKGKKAKKGADKGKKLELETAGGGKNGQTDRKRLEAVLNSVPKVRFEKKLGKWVIPLFYYEELRKILMKIGAQISPVPKAILQIFKSKIDTETKKKGATVDLSGISPALLKSLYKFQLQGVVFALQNNGRCIIGDEMGLGKTIQAIAIAACYRSEWPLLIISPSSVRMNWGEEFKKWLEVCPLDINVVMTAKEKFDSLINIVSYDLVHKMLDQLKDKKFKVIIADESHYLKTRTAKRTKALLPVLSNANRVILLSGTPALSRPEELYTQLMAVQPSLFPDFKAFAVRYCNAHKAAFGWDTAGASHLTELHSVLMETAMIRRRKAEVLHELPAKQRHTIQLECTVGEQLQDGLCELKKLEHTIHKFGNTEKGRSAKKDKRMLTAMMFIETARVKMPSVQQYLANLLLSNGKKLKDKLIIFAHHKEMMDGIEETLKEHSISFMRIDGATNGAIRQQLVDQFQRGRSQVALLSVTAGGMGITLHAASMVIFAELYWTPAILLQAEDRAHRLGQLKAVNIFYLLGKGTLDDSIWPLISRKLDIIGRTVDGENDQNMNATDMDQTSTLQFCSIFEDENEERPSNLSENEDDEIADDFASTFSAKKSWKSELNYSSGDDSISSPEPVLASSRRISLERYSSPEIISSPEDHRPFFTASKWKKEKYNEEAEDLDDDRKDELSEEFGSEENSNEYEFPSRSTAKKARRVLVSASEEENPLMSPILSEEIEIL